MLCAPAVAWEISAPPTTPRGTSCSSPGLTSFMAPSLAPLAGGDLDLQRRLIRCLVVDLEGRVIDAEAFAHERLQLPAALMAIVAGSCRRSCANASASITRPSR